MLKPFEKKHLTIRTGNAVFVKNSNQDKEKPSILKVFEYYFPQDKTRKSHKAVMSLCPFHGENKPSFAMYPETNSYYCFSCSETGDSFSFIMKIAGCNFKEALEVAGDNNLY